MLAVEGYVVLLGDVRSFGVFVAVPGHLDVDVGGAPESLSFQGGGDGDALVVAFVEGGAANSAVVTSISEAHAVRTAHVPLRLCWGFEE